MSERKRREAGQDLKKSMDDFRVGCRQVGLKVTPQRTAVYRALLQTDEHPSAEMVFRRVRRTFPSISLDTVNRALATLTDIGMAFAVEGSGDARRYDANMETHQHFKCIKCKRIVDFHFEPFDQINVPTCISRKFTVLRKTVYLEGLCERCSKKMR